MNDYRSSEVQSAIKAYFDEMDDIQMKYIELIRQETDARCQLKQTLYAETPDMLAPKYFQKP